MENILKDTVRNQMYLDCLKIHISLEKLTILKPLRIVMGHATWEKIK